MRFFDDIFRKIHAYREYSRALDFERKGLDKDAEAAYRRVIGIDPSFYKAYTNLGSVILKYPKHSDVDSAARFTEAVQYYEKALKIRPDDPVSLFNLGTIYYLRTDDEERAFDYFAQTINADFRSVPKVQQYLSWASYHPKEDFNKVAARSLHLLTEKNIRNSVSVPEIKPVYLKEHFPGEYFEGYTCRGYGLSLKIPKGWKDLTPRSAGTGDDMIIAFRSPKGPAFNIIAGPQTYGKNASVDDLETQSWFHIHNISGNLIHFQRRKIGDIEAVEIDYTALTMRTKKVGFLRNDLEFLITCSAQPHLYISFEPLFNDIIDSMIFSE